MLPEEGHPVPVDHQQKELAYATNTASATRPSQGTAAGDRPKGATPVEEASTPGDCGKPSVIKQSQEGQEVVPKKPDLFCSFLRQQRNGH